MGHKTKVIVVLGTRPEIIKTSAILRLLKKNPSGYRLIHTGQHYSFSMDRVFFKELGLPEPQYQLDLKSAAGETRLDYVARMTAAIEKILLKEAPCAVLVQGDTNSVLAGALASRRVPGVTLGHIEAGLRSYDRSMPEELNRIKTDHISDFLFAPTANARKILAGEKIPAKKIHVTGNTIVDAVKGNLRLSALREHPAKKFKNELGGDKEYFLLTLHRQENVDDRKRLKSILDGLDLVSRHFQKKILFPVHPRTHKLLLDPKMGLKLPGLVVSIPPMGFLDFLNLEKKASLILTDSGGVQEEACILGIPCVTLRTTTERPETVKAGGNIVAGRDPQKILSCAKKMMNKKRNWKNPFGDGKASERILKAVQGPPVGR